jgi:uncharacterized SAM-binding protein YcdF (DUF218 family)
MAATMSPSSTATHRAPPRRVVGMLLRHTLLAAALFVVVGFFAFVTHVIGQTPPAATPRAEAIIVLTGGQDRLKPAFTLLAQKAGRKLLVSGVNLTTRKADLLDGLDVDPELLACCVELDHKALDTVGNAEQSARWLRRNNFGSVILVTSNYHMPRAVRELKRLAGTASIVPYPLVASDLTNGRWVSEPDTLRVLVVEYIKLCLSFARTMVSPPPGEAALARL